MPIIVIVAASKSFDRANIAISLSPPAAEPMSAVERGSPESRESRNPLTRDKPSIQADIMAAGKSVFLSKDKEFLLMRRPIITPNTILQTEESSSTGASGNRPQSARIAVAASDPRSAATGRRSILKIK
jgi:hypothetical protein